jgi:crotonobetainyl-CoA:carnitine CoA-transferase CaiB-like acyl-CoA transferase
MINASQGRTAAGRLAEAACVDWHPHVRHRGMRLHPPSADAKGGTVQGIRTPIMLDRAPMAAPKLGEHTAEILREIGEG